MGDSVPRNDTELPARETVVTRYLLERHAVERPDDLCAVDPDGVEWTWAQALDQANRAAGALQQHGIGRGDRVAIFLENGLDWLRAWWGAASLGAVMVTVNSSFRGGILKQVLEDSGAQLVITSDERRGRVTEVGLELPLVEPSELSAADPISYELTPPLEPWDVHAINFTSGTTGPSKGVLTPYLATFMGGYYGFGSGAGLRADDRWLIDTPLFHVSGQMTAMAALSVGASMAIRVQFAGTSYWKVAAETGATRSLLVGTMASFLQSQSPTDDDRAHRLQVIAVVPTVPDPEGFMSRFGVRQLAAMFGQTEISSPLGVIPGERVVPGSVGRPRTGAQVRIVDEHDRPVQPGAVGELIVRTDRPWEMNLGYVGNAEATVTAWRNGWFHTGDAFRCDQDGYYFYVDRMRDTLRRRGENVSSFQVEVESVAHPDVLEAACIGVPAEHGEDEVKVFLVPLPGRQVDPIEFIGFLEPRLPHFMIPRYVEVVQELPKNQTLRVQKFLLRSRGNGADTWDRLSETRVGEGAA